jgi:hypothetical protein
MASAYLLTGEDQFLEAAEKGTEYLREHMRFFDSDEDLIYWYHGIQVTGNREQKLLTSEFGDDYDSIPMYEQIYALAGPIQTYRVTGDPRILHDSEYTLKLFDRFYLDRTQGGYFSHIDPISLDPRAESLAHNRARKNWNSVGDHAPAYLINLRLATGEQKYVDFLEALRPLRRAAGLLQKRCRAEAADRIHPSSTRARAPTPSQTDGNVGAAFQKPDLNPEYARYNAPRSPAPPPLRRRRRCCRSSCYRFDRRHRARLPRQCRARRGRSAEYSLGSYT